MVATSSLLNGDTASPGDFSPAVLLTSQSDFRQHRTLIRLLNFFGIPWRTETATDLLQRLVRGESAPVRLFSRPNGFIELLHRIRSEGDAASFLIAQIHSVFIYGPDTSSSGNELRELALEVEVDCGATRVEVAPNHRLSGIMAGLRFSTGGRTTSGSIATLKVRAGQDVNAVPILSTGSGAVFSEITYRGTSLFITTTPDLIDLDNELLSGVFNIREHAFTALPIVLYLKWAFAETRWSAPAASASLVIDDPLLKQRHGFLEYNQLLDLMRQHNFATTVAFIPWNWRRSAPQTVALFTANPNYYSLSIHGCNHTAAEFGNGDREFLFEKSQRALLLMELHERETAIHHDRVMVFPHGVFNEAAMAAIKRTDFFATASNEVISKDKTAKVVTVADVWDVALMRYSECALFTRRSLSDGIEDIAFDLLLGKPGLIVLHHDDCDDDYRRVTDLVDRINALPIELQWRGLGDALRRSFRQRQSAPGIIEVEMYGTELILENRWSEAMRFDVIRLESDPRVVRTLTADAKPLDWTVRDNRIAFSLQLRAEEKVAIRLRYYPLKVAVPAEDTMSVRTRTLLRRYLCEARDNYWARYRRSSSALGQMKALPAAQQNNGSRVVNGELAETVRIALFNFTHWLKRYGELSWDHQSFFAGVVGRRAKSIYYRSGKLGTAAVAPMIFLEAVFPAGRRFFHRPIRFPIADAHYAMGFLFLYRATNDSSYLERAIHFLNELMKSRSPGFKEYCWGYPFDWVTRGGLIEKDTPFITTTPYVYEAFLQAFEIEARPEWKEIMASIARHARFDIKDFETSSAASSCSYSPYGEGGVVNAAAYRSSMLFDASKLFSNEDYRKVAERNLNFVLETQNTDGSWYYAVGDVRDFVDHYHTCFVMKALGKIYALTGNDKCRQALDRGVNYYLKNLFDQDGLPKPFSKPPRLTVYRRELYDCAECINLCLILRKWFPQLEQTLEAVVAEVMRHWVKRDGSFRSRRLHFSWDNVPMHRWGQSQMFRSLAYYLFENEPPALVSSKNEEAFAEASIGYTNQ